MLHIFQLSHLGNELSRGGKFFVGGPDLGFAITWDQRLRKSWGSFHHHLFNNSPQCNPHFHVLEGLHKVTDISGKLPRRINSLPMQGILLDDRNQHKMLQAQMQLTYMVQPPNCMPAHHSNEVPRNVTWLHLEMGLDGHQVVSDSAGNGSLHDGRDKLEEWEKWVGWP